MSNYLARPVVFALGAVVLSLLVTTSEAVSQGFTGIGFLGGGTQESQALGVSKHGTQVVGSSGYNEPFPSWHHQGKPIAWWPSSGGPGALAGLPPVPDPDVPGGPGGQACGISEDGTIIVGYSYIQPDPADGGYTAVRWKKPFGPSSLLRLQPLAGYKYSRAISVSRHGSVIVGYGEQSGSGSTPYRAGCYWKTRSAPTALKEGVPDAEPGTTWPTSISSNGRVIVGSIRLKSPAGVLMQHPVIWVWNKQQNDFGEPRLLPLLPGATEGLTNDVSRDGGVVVGMSKMPDGNYVPCKWVHHGNGYTVKTIPNLPPGGVTGTASAVSRDGEVIAGFMSVIDTAGDYIPTAWIWSKSRGTRTLAAALTIEGVSSHGQWLTLQPYDISSDGHTIVGTGWNPDNLEEGWVATLSKP